MIGHSIRDDQFIVVDESATGINNIRHVTFAFALVGFDQGFPQSSDNFARIIAIQQELTANTAVSVGYVGSHGYHELIGIDANEPFPVICPAAPCPATYPSKFPTGIAGTAVPAGTYYVPTAVRANAALANTWTYFSEGDSSYQALQVDVNHRFSDGLALRGVYTWSKNLDDLDGAINELFFACRSRHQLLICKREYLTAAKSNRYGHRDATMILVAFRHGFRASEIIELE